MCSLFYFTPKLKLHDTTDLSAYLTKMTEEASISHVQSSIHRLPDALLPWRLDAYHHHLGHLKTQKGIKKR